MSRKRESGNGSGEAAGCLGALAVVAVCVALCLLPPYVLMQVMAALGHPVPFWVCAGIWWLAGLLVQGAARQAGGRER